MIRMYSYRFPFSVSRLAFWIIGVAALLSAGCSSRPDAQQIVDRAIAAHGSEKLQQAVVEFDFRDRHYRAERDGGTYAYHRIFTDSTGQVHDVLTNDSFTRRKNGKEVALPEKQKRNFTASVNGVIYFALLPFSLNDQAVIKEYVGEATIKGEPYHKVLVTFQEEGGGEDHEDVFVYWFHQQRHTMDYLAYSYQEDDGMGTRFREAINSRDISGIRFLDYINYRTDSMQVPLEQYDRLFKAGHMEELSRVELENVRVVKQAES